MAIKVSCNTALGFLDMAIAFQRALEADYATIVWDASMYAPAGAPRLDGAARDVVRGVAGVERVEPVLVNTIGYRDTTFPVFGMTATALYRPRLREGRWYDAEEAFSRAFKRDSGVSPGAWRNGLR